MDPTGSYVCYLCVAKCERETCRAERDMRRMHPCSRCSKKCCPQCVHWDHTKYCNLCVECTIGDYCHVTQCVEWVPQGKSCTGCSKLTHLCVAHERAFHVIHDDSNWLLCNACGGPCVLCQRHHDTRVSKFEPCSPCQTFLRQASTQAAHTLFAMHTPLYPDLVDLVLQHVKIATTMLY
jgi:hypothetical protein